MMEFDPSSLIIKNNKMFNSSAVFIAFLAFFARLVCSDVLARIDGGTHIIGVYWPGPYVSEHLIFKGNQPEHYIKILQPSEVHTEMVKLNTSLLFRSSDMATRVLVTFDRAVNDVTRPYKIGFHNLAIEDRGGNKPIELKHGNSGYIWIDGGKHQEHNTDVGHTFTVRDTNKADVFSVTLYPTQPEL